MTVRRLNDLPVPELYPHFLRRYVTLRYMIKLSHMIEVTSP